MENLLKIANLEREFLLNPRYQDLGIIVDSQDIAMKVRSHIMGKFGYSIRIDKNTDGRCSMSLDAGKSVKMMVYSEITDFLSW